MEHEELRAKLKERAKSPESIKELESFKGLENILTEGDLDKYVMDTGEIDRLLPLGGTKKGI